MSTGLIITSVLFFFIAGGSTSYIEQNGIWAPIVFGSAGLLFFLSGFSLRIIERGKIK